jgi:hypothetical protein
MYLLKLRRDEAPVPSTLLWHKLVADVEANAPWQRLRRSLLLLLQLLLVVILALLAARPFLERPAGLARDIVLVIDTSASMQATDVTPNRLEAAKAAAIESLRDLPAGGKVSVVSGRTAKVVVNGTSDIGRVKGSIAGIEPTSSVGDLGDALRLASALAARSGDAEILVATDAALAQSHGGALEAPVRVLQVGRDADNQAIVALAVRTAPSGLTLRVRVRGEPGPRDGRAADRAVRGRPAARGPHADPRPAAPHGRLDRRHRRGDEPGHGGRGPAGGR